jgi:hypothetical protein
MRCRNAEMKKLDPNFEVEVCHGCVKIPETCDSCYFEEQDKSDILEQLLKQKKKRMEDQRKKIRKKRLDPNNENGSARPSPDFNTVAISQEDLLVKIVEP